MALPTEILFGIYLGILTGIVPAVVAGVLGFLFKYVTGVTVPGLGVVVLSLAIAGINGGLMALNDQSIRTSERAPAILTAIIVVLMLSLYAHAQGDKLGASLPKRVSLQSLRNRRLSADVVELVGGRGQVRLTVPGEVGDMEGYPPLPAETRKEIAAGDWTFPADLPVVELEERFADRLRSEFDLADVTVAIDRKGRATVGAAPPVGGLSKRVPQGKRAVSLSALVPTGLARGESVRLLTPEATVEGTLVSAKSAGGPAGTPPAADPPADEPPATDGGQPTDPAPAPTRAPTTDGGEGRVTVAVDRSEAGSLLRAERASVVVLSRGTRREFELTSLLRRAGKRFRKATVTAGGPLDGHTIREASVRETWDVVVLAVRGETWEIAPRGGRELAAGDELFVVGTREALDRFAEVAA